MIFNKIFFITSMNNNFNKKNKILILINNMITTFTLINNYFNKYKI